MQNNSHFLVDTSVWLFVLRKDFISKIKDRIDSLLKEDKILTANIIKLEILGGTKTDQEFHLLKVRLDSLDLIEMDNVLWERACELAFRMRRKGLNIPYTDILIASCAMREGSPLIHADAHFDLMANHIGLKVESFVQAVREEV